MLVNPISFRLGICLFWGSTWTIYNIKNLTYKYLFYSDLIFFEFFMFFFKKVIESNFWDFYCSHIKLYRNVNNLIINLYIHISKEIFFNFINIFCVEKKINRLELILLKKKKFKSVLMIIKKMRELKKKYYNLYIKIKKKKKKNIVKKFVKKIKKIKKINNTVKKKVNKKKKKWIDIEIIKNIRYLFLKKKKNFTFFYIYRKFNKIKNKKSIKNKGKLKKIKEYYKKKKKWIFVKNLFLYKIVFLKYIYIQKILIYNYFYYLVGYILEDFSKIWFNKYLKNIKFKFNIFQIQIGIVNASIICKYIQISLKKKYSIYETIKPILIDLKLRLKMKQLKGFKIKVSGRFKRHERATYWWQQDGLISTGTITSGIDYSINLLRTKYGVSTLSVWLLEGNKVLNGLNKEYSNNFLPFFLIIKKNKQMQGNYILLKIKKYFNKNIIDDIEDCINKNNFKMTILGILLRYMYINIFLKNIFFKNIFIIQKIFLPQYCMYKIELNNYLIQFYIKIIPFIQIKLLKRMNIRHSYKIIYLYQFPFKNIQYYEYLIDNCLKFNEK